MRLTFDLNYLLNKYRTNEVPEAHMRFYKSYNYFLFSLPKDYCNWNRLVYHALCMLLIHLGDLNGDFATEI